MKKITLLFGAVLFISSMVFAQESYVKPTKVVKAAFFDKSKPLRDVTPVEPGTIKRTWKDNKVENHFIDAFDYGDQSNVVDPVVQTKFGTDNGTRGPIQNFAGMGNIDFVYPPDTDGDVSPDHYFQMINLSFQIFDKDGNSLYGPADNSTLWDGFVGPWTGTNDGDPIVLYDEGADRWVATQFAVNGSGGYDYELVAVSVTNDPMGEYYRYAFEYDDFNDYPKLGVWNDSYVCTYNMFNSFGSFLGAGVAAFERDKMLVGDPDASQQFFQLSSSYYGMLPADYDGDIPPDGAPNYITHMKRSGTRAIQLFEFVVDWDTPDNSSVTLVSSLSPESYSSYSTGVPQPNTTQVLDDFVGQALYRLAYRNFGDYEAMVMNHGVTVSGQHGIRWYELRKEEADWYIYQQGTFAPDDDLHRWMGSIAINATGDIALGYSVSGEDDVYPSIRYTGRTADADLGEMNMGEVEIIAGTSSQSGIERWGDYASLSVDPADGETFWFTTEYMGSGWRTRIASFDLEPIAAPIVDAGPDSIICSTGLFNTAAASGESVNEYEWTTSGDGNFVPNNSALEVNYLRGNEDIENGGAWLYLTGYGYQEGLVDVDSLYLTIASEPEVDLGPDSTICDNVVYEASPEVSDAGSLLWTTSGNGTFDDATIAQAVYTPGSTDLAVGFVTLTLEAQPTEPCESADDDSIVVSFTDCTSNNNIEFNEALSVFPNPSNGVFTVSQEMISAKEAMITVTNSAGTVVYSNDLSANANKVSDQIDLTNEAKGVYFVRIQMGDNVSLKKIILK